MIINTINIYLICVNNCKNNYNATAKKINISNDR